MRRILFICCMMLSSALTMAQEEAPGKKGNFDPKAFEQDLEQYIVKEAGLTKAEEEKFLPIYREMRQKQIKVMDSGRKALENKPTTEKDFETLLKTHDNEDIELKKIAQTYHNKMLTVVPASKVIKVIRAEQNFHRNTFRQHIGTNPPPRPKK